VIDCIVLRYVRTNRAIISNNYVMRVLKEALTGERSIGVPNEAYFLPLLQAARCDVELMIWKSISPRLPENAVVRTGA